MGIQAGSIKLVTSESKDSQGRLDLDSPESSDEKVNNLAASRLSQQGSELSNSLVRNLLPTPEISDSDAELRLPAEIIAEIFSHNILDDEQLMKLLEVHPNIALQASLLAIRKDVEQAAKVLMELEITSPYRDQILDLIKINIQRILTDSKKMIKLPELRQRESQKILTELTLDKIHGRRSHLLVRFTKRCLELLEIEDLKKFYSKIGGRRNKYFGHRLVYLIDARKKSEKMIVEENLEKINFNNCSPHQFIRALQRCPRNHQTAERFSYCNSGFNPSTSSYKNIFQIDSVTSALIDYAKTLTSDEDKRRSLELICYSAAKPDVLRKVFDEAKNMQDVSSKKCLFSKLVLSSNANKEFILDVLKVSEELENESLIWEVCMAIIKVAEKDNDLILNVLELVKKLQEHPCLDMVYNRLLAGVKGDKQLILKILSAVEKTQDKNIIKHTYMQALVENTEISLEVLSAVKNIQDVSYQVGIYEEIARQFPSNELLRHNVIEAAKELEDDVSKFEIYILFLIYCSRNLAIIKEVIRAAVQIKDPQLRKRIEEMALNKADGDDDISKEAAALVS